MAWATTSQRSDLLFDPMKPVREEDLLMISLSPLAAEDPFVKTVCPRVDDQLASPVYLLPDEGQIAYQAYRQSLVPVDVVGLLFLARLPLSYHQAWAVLNQLHRPWHQVLLQILALQGHRVEVRY